MSRVNCVVDDGNSTLTYDKAAPELQGLKGDFTIQPGGATDTGVFEIRRGGEVVRRHESRPFPSGALKTKGTSDKKVSFVAKLKKLIPINLDDYF